MNIIINEKPPTEIAIASTPSLENDYYRVCV